MRQILIERAAVQQRQGHLAVLAALADSMQPVVALCIVLDAAQPGVDHLTGSQTRRVPEVQHEAQVPGALLAPSTDLLDAVGDGANERPFLLPEHPGRIKGAATARSLDLHAGEGVGQHIAALDQPAIQRSDHGQCIGGGARRQRCLERAPFRGRARPRRADLALPRLWATQEGAVRHGIFGRQR